MLSNVWFCWFCVVRLISVLETPGEAYNVLTYLIIMIYSIDQCICVPHLTLVFVKNN